MAAVTLVWFRHDLRLDDNPALLADTLERLIDEPDLRRKLAAEGSERVRQAFSMEAMVRDSLAVFERQLSGHQAISAQQS